MIRRAIAALLVVAAGCGSCSGDDGPAGARRGRAGHEAPADDDPGGGTPAEPAHDVDPVAATNARQALLASFRATREHKYRTRATMEVRRPGQTPRGSTWTMEFVPPDRRSGVMSLPNGLEAHMLSIGRRVWGRQHRTDRWMESATGMTGAAGELETRMVEAIESGALHAESLGPDRTSNRESTVYAITWTLPPGGPSGGGTMTGRVWISSDGLALRFQGESDRPPSTIDMTYEYDDSITIVEPRPDEVGSPQ